jgi:hypothetical protein
MNSNRYSAIIGAVVGLYKYFCDISIGEFSLHLIQAVVIAFLSGIASVIGKELFVFMKKLIKKVNK